jgi:hypothetical protein
MTKETPKPSTSTPSPSTDSLKIRLGKRKTRSGVRYYIKENPVKSGAPAQTPGKPVQK